MNIYRVLFYILWTKLSSFIFFATGSLNLQSKNSTSPTLDIDKCLSTPLKDIPYLNLLLRTEYLQSDSQNIYVLWFLRSNLCPLIVTTYSVTDLDVDGISSEPKFIHKRESYAIVSDIPTLGLISKRFMQKASTFFFILTDDNVDYPKLLEILQFMWRAHSIFRCYILISEGVLIYDPFEYNDERNEYGQMKLYSGDRKLVDIIFDDMRGYPLRTQIFKSVYARPQMDKDTGKILSIGGVDGKLGKMLEQRMNFTMKLQFPDPHQFGERSENGTYNGAIGSVINNEIDLCLTGFFVKDYMVPEMTFTVAAYDDKLCIYVPKAKRIPQSILPIFSVGSNLWLGFILAAFASGTIWCVIRYLNLWMTAEGRKKPRLYKKLKRQLPRIFSDTWVVWVRVGINRYPPFYSERIFVVSLCLVSVIFGAIFESSLATVYIHPMYFRDINTLQELDESGLKIIYKFSTMADDLFFSETSPLFASLNKKLTYLGDLNADVTLDIAENGGKASVTRKSSILLESTHFILSKKIWMVPECPKTYTISYVMPKDSPIEETVNGLILRALNAGLIRKWIDEMHASVNIKVMNGCCLKTQEVFKVLQITDLQLAFYVVFFGSFLGGFLLVVEIYMARKERRKAI